MQQVTGKAHSSTYWSARVRFAKGHANFLAMVPALVIVLLTVWAIQAAPPRQTFDLSAYGARGDGVTNDTSSVQSALNAAARAGPGAVVTSRPGRTFLVSRLTVPGHHITLNLRGSTIKAEPSTGGALVVVTGSDAVLTHLTIDANRAAREALLWQGANGIVRDSHLTTGPYLGLLVSNSAVVTATAVTATNFKDVCFDVGSGTLITSADHAAYCGYAGFYFGQSSTGNVLNGTAAHNGVGAIIANRGGQIGRFMSNDDNRFGLIMQAHAAHWTAGYVETDNVGFTERIPDGTGVELIGSSHNVFNHIVSNRNPGYALALASGSSDNRVALLSADNTGGWNANPGLLIDTGSNNNRVAQAAVTGYSVCLHIGETAPYTPSSGNWVGQLTATRCLYDAIRIDYGNRNRIGKAVVVGCGAISNPDQPYLGTVDFARRSANNSVGDLDQQPSTSKAWIPKYAVSFGPDTRGNRIESGHLRAWTVRPTRDDGQNYAPFNAAGDPLLSPRGIP